MPHTDGRWKTSRFVDPAGPTSRHARDHRDVRAGCGDPVRRDPCHGARLVRARRQGRVRLNEDWVEVQEGDFMWLRAFCPQACSRGPGSVPVSALQGRQPAHAAAAKCGRVTEEGRCRSAGGPAPSSARDGCADRVRSSVGGTPRRGGRAARRAAQPRHMPLSERSRRRPRAVGAGQGRAMGRARLRAVGGAGGRRLRRVGRLPARAETGADFALVLRPGSGGTAPRSRGRCWSAVSTEPGPRLTW